MRQIGKALSVNLGNATFGDIFSLGANTTVGGATTLTNSGLSTLPFNALFDFEGTINGSLSINLGGGDGAVTSDAGVVLGNLTITGGNGVDTIMGLTKAAFDATVAGNLTVSLGNGTDSADIANAPTGVFRWTSGNGSDTLTLDPDGGATTPGPSQTWNVNFLFGSNDDTLTLNAATNPQFITGLVDMGGRVTANTFNQGTNWSTAGYFQLKNVP